MPTPEISKHSISAIVLPSEVRREQTERELARLEKSIQSWFALRNSRDRDILGKYAGLHKTRLETLEQVLQYGLEALKQEFAKIGIGTGKDVQEVYAKCRAFDRAVVYMQRVWQYYREKFDQRDDRASIGQLLQAADEVIWSCYSQVFINGKNLPPGVVQGPAPLAYIDAEYSPATWEAGKLSPSELRQSNDIQGLENFLQTLPIPVVRLPPWCIESSWWLIFTAHEVGHNVQRKLDLVDSFGGILEKACLDKGHPMKPYAEKWRRWSAEIFADLFSVIMMGRWAIRALLEVEYGPWEEMNASNSSYPAPLVRLALMVGAADRLGLAGSQVLDGIDPLDLGQDNSLTKVDLNMVQPILDAALGPLSDQVGSLDKLCGLQEARVELETKVEYWSKSLPKDPPNPTRSLQAPRFITSGAMAAWKKTVQNPNSAERQAALLLLSKNTVEILSISGPEGERAILPQPSNLKEHGTNLAQWLLRVSNQADQQGLDAEGL